MLFIQSNLWLSLLFQSLGQSVLDLDNLDWSKCRYQPFTHQIQGVKALLLNKVFGILDEMGAGKTKQIIDTACFLHEAQYLDIVVIICPAQVKDVWAHEKYSQIIEHAWIRGTIVEFSSKTRSLPTDSGLVWLITSVEMLRNPVHVRTIQQLIKGKRTWGVVDESSTISNHKASQTQGCLNLGKSFYRRTILNGTPIGNRGPLDLYSQFQFLDPSILGFKSFYGFRNKYARMGGWMNKQVIGFENVEEVQKNIKPYVLRRLKADCLDILPKMRAPLIEVKLSKETWAKYVSMREEFVAYVDDYEGASIVSAAPIKALRLAQMCSGFLGGVPDDEDNSEPVCVEISSELTDIYLDRLAFRLSIDPKFKNIVWCRFRPEIARLEKKMRERFPDMNIKVLQGGLSRKNRDEAKSLFHPDAPDPIGAATLIAQPQAGRFGSNFVKCFNVDRLSSDYSHLTWVQSEDRVHRPGQKEQTLFQDYVVVGPNRERTISGIILKALRTHEELAKWTCSRWQTEIMKEEDNDIPF